MKRHLVIFLCFIIPLFLVGACSSQQPVEEKRIKSTPKLMVQTSESIGANLDLWVWSVLSSDKGVQETKEIIKDNEIVVRSLSNSGRIPVPYNGYLMLEVDLLKLGKKLSTVSAEWILESKNDEPRHGISQADASKKRSQGFNIDFMTDFDVTINIKEGENIIASKQLLFAVASPPTIQIVQPVNDKIVNYGEKVKFIANAVDGSGNFPMVIWVVKHGEVERVLGVGNEIETDRLDIGYNTINAYALNLKGAVMKADPVHVIIPYKATKTLVISPKDNQEFDWNQPVLFYARGNDLQYAITDANTLSEVDEPTKDLSFTSGSGLLKPSLPPGNYRVTFRGKFGTDSHQFTIKDKLQDIAEVTRIEGYVLMSGKRGEWHQVKSGDKIPEGYIIRAIGNGLAEIHLNNGVVYILNQGNAIRILSNGNIVKNLNQEDLALYSLVDPGNIQEVQKNLKPLIGQLDQLLKNHRIVEMQSENKEDILRLLDLIFKGQLKIDEVTIE